MAGLRGNQAYMVNAKQTVKGTPIEIWQDTVFFTSNSSLAPSKAIGQLAETDNNRQAGNNFVQTTAVEGSPQFYVRDASIGHWLEYVLGGVANSGSVGEYKHVYTPAATIPYVTLGRGIGATLFEQFQDCMISDLTIQAGTASPLTAQATVIGLKANRKTEEWKETKLPPAASTQAPYNFNEALIKLGGAETRLISSFNCTISNNVTLQQTDDSIPYDVVPGTFQVTMGFDLIFENLKEYNKFHYGGEAGTEQKNEIFVTEAEFEFVKEAKKKVIFKFPQLAYQTFPVDPDPGGSPIVASVTAAAQRGANPFVTAEVLNAVEK